MKSIRDQFTFLRRLTDQIQQGTVRGLRSRVTLYALSAKHVYEDTRLKVHTELGHTQMRRIQHSVEPCPDCTALAAQQWQPIGSLPLPTQESQCGNRCRCTVQYR